MMRRSYVLMVLAIFALLVTVSLQGCLFGGGGGDEASGGDEAGGDGAAPADAGGEMMGGGEEPGGEMPGGEAPGGEIMGGGEMPSEDMGMGGEEMGGETAAPATASGASSAALQTKRSGDWSGASAQCEAALAANADDAEAHRVLGWILADTDAAGAIEHFNAYLDSGAEGPDADEAKAAIERL